MGQIQRKNTLSFSLLDSGIGESIPYVVYDEAADSSCMVVQQLKTISSDIEQIKENQSVLADMTNQINDLTHIVNLLIRQNSSLKGMTKSLQKSMRQMTMDLHSLMDKEKIKEKNPKSPERSENLASRKGLPRRDWAQMMHIEEALQENVHHFIDNLSFSSTPIPDILLESECLSDDECSVIRSKNEKDQVRHLLYKMMTRGPERIFQFLDILKENDYESLARNVYKSLERLASADNDKSTKCLVCLLKRNVDLRDISDYLFRVKIINREIYGAILDNPTLYENKDSIWAKILHGVNEADDFDKAKEHLIGAVSGKYEYLVQHLHNFKSFSLQCLCGTKRRRLRKGLLRNLGSQTDISTTSDLPYLKHLRSNDSVSEPDSTSVLSSMDLGATYANLSSYQRISFGPCDSTAEKEETSIKAKERVRYSSGNFDVGQHRADTTPEFYNQQSVPYVSHEPSKNRPSLEQSVSHVSEKTVQKSESTGSEDKISKTNSSESKPRLSFSQSETTDLHVDENSDSIRDTRDVKPKTVNKGQATKWMQDQHTPKQKMYERFSDGSSSAYSEDERAIHLDRKTRLRKIGERKQSRKSKSKIVPFGLRQPEKSFHMKKRNKKRKERRDIKLESYNSGEPSRNIKISDTPSQRRLPYNPTWSTHLQRPLTSSWDYNQARRHWLMSHRVAKMDCKAEVYTDQSWTEGSETEYTI